MTMAVGFSVLIWVTGRVYQDAPPIPDRVVNAAGETVFTGADIVHGQQVFLKYGLMDNGTIWGHGAYLGPDFSAQYLHTLAVDADEALAKQNYGRLLTALTEAQRAAVNAEVAQLLRQNGYDARSGTLTYSAAEVTSYRKQIGEWAAYFVDPAHNGGLPAKYIRQPEELRQLTAFFAWACPSRKPVVLDIVDFVLP